MFKYEKETCLKCKSLQTCAWTAYNDNGVIKCVHYFNFKKWFEEEIPNINDALYESFKKYIDENIKTELMK